MHDLAQRFSDPRPIILDGATSTELQRMGVPMSADTWSGLAAISHPDVLRELHVQYLRAGAEVIIANTYAAAPQHVAAAGFGDRAREINLRSAELALEAREAAADGPAWVAGSLSLMAPGFRSANRQAPLQHAEGLRQQAEWLAEAGVDLLVLEMLRDIEWSSAAVDAALSVGLPVWSGFSCVVDDGGTVMTQGTVGEPVPLDDALARGRRPRGNARRRHAFGDRRHRARAGLRPPGVRGAARGVAQLRDHRAAGLAVHRGGDAGGVRRGRGAMGGRRSEGDWRVLRSRTGTHPGGGQSSEILTAFAPHAATRVGSTRGRRVNRSSGDDLHQHGEDDERRGVGDSDSDGWLRRTWLQAPDPGPRGGETRGRRESRASEPTTCISTTRTASDAAYANPTRVAASTNMVPISSFRAAGTPVAFLERNYWG